VIFRYYPTQFKYVALFPGGENDDDSSRSSAVAAQAREIAIAAWKEDIERGVRDKVTHAMEVEYSSEKKKIDKDVGADDERIKVVDVPYSESGNKVALPNGVAENSSRSNKKRTADDREVRSYSSNGDASLEKQQPTSKKMKSTVDDSQYQQQHTSVKISNTSSNDQFTEHYRGDDDFFVEEAQDAGDTNTSQLEAESSMKNIRAMMQTHGGNKWADRHKKKRVFKNDRRLNRK
jgi:hypothetical protein